MYNQDVFCIKYFILSLRTKYNIFQLNRICLVYYIKNPINLNLMHYLNVLCLKYLLLTQSTQQNIFQLIRTCLDLYIKNQIKLNLMHN